MILRTLTGTLGLALIFPAAGVARPISYPGGTSVMANHTPLMDMLDVNYTLNSRWALGANVMYDREGEYTTAGPTVTRGWRWNYPDSQANVYTWAGAGGAVFDDRTRPTAWGGASVDWEDRRWYTQAAITGQTIADGPDSLAQSVRLGVAPYVAESGQLHTWFIVQGDHTPGMNETWSVTPMVRQFWGANLWEVGISSRGGVLFNFTKTF